MLLYNIFHLNLAYSSIEEEQRPEVIQKCYWPLLNLIEDLQIPAGVEATVYTLESIAAIDYKWIEKLKELVNQDLIEFVGSGYAQIIGPLVPAGVNEANLYLGNQGYEQLLGIRPRTALINEQAYSSGLVEIYKNAGYEAIIMEWNNPAHAHPDWQDELQYYPQYALGSNGCKLPVIWNNSVAFQKFQRYAHSDMELEEYLDYLNRQFDRDGGMFSLYGNDVEIFDFRPGRYQTEAALSEESEWQGIRRLFELLKDDERIKIAKPGEVLSLLDKVYAGNILSLQSAEQPVTVKKQAKYNITRWAVTGRDDIGSNTRCWCIYEQLQRNKGALEEEWKELCYLWSSDFRTHITEKRWENYLKRLSQFEHSLNEKYGMHNEKSLWAGKSTRKSELFEVRRQGRYLIIKTEQCNLWLDCQRGLAINRFWGGVSDGTFLCGTLPHGFFEDISLDSDWYSGHSIIECLGKPKITDLNPVHDLDIKYSEDNVIISAVVDTAEGTVYKSVRVSSSEPEIAIHYRFIWNLLPPATFRCAHITINPEAFERQSLYYATHNGGRYPEIFPLAGRDVDLGAPVSFLVSSNGCLGMTEGWLEIGDSARALQIEVDKTEAALVGLLNYQEIKDKYFLRVAFSAGEWDETRKNNQLDLEPLEFTVRIRVIEHSLVN